MIPGFGRAPLFSPQEDSWAGSRYTLVSHCNNIGGFSVFRNGQSCRDLFHIDPGHVSVSRNDQSSLSHCNKPTTLSVGVFISHHINPGSIFDSRGSWGASPLRISRVCYDHDWFHDFLIQLLLRTLFNNSWQIRMAKWGLSSDSWMKKVLGMIKLVYHKFTNKFTYRIKMMIVGKFSAAAILYPVLVLLVNIFFIAFDITAKAVESRGSVVSNTHERCRHFAAEIFHILALDKAPAIFAWALFLLGHYGKIAHWHYHNLIHSSGA